MREGESECPSTWAWAHKHNAITSLQMQVKENARKAEWNWWTKRENVEWIISGNQNLILSRQQTSEEPTIYAKDTQRVNEVTQSPAFLLLTSSGWPWLMWQQEAHTAVYRAPPNCFHCPTMAKRKHAYLDVTGEEDLLAMLPGNSHLLRGDPRPTLGTEVVVRGPRFIFSDWRGHRRGQPWPITGNTSTIS